MRKFLLNKFSVNFDKLSYLQAKRRGTISMLIIVFTSKMITSEFLRTFGFVLR